MTAQLIPTITIFLVFVLRNQLTKLWEESDVNQFKCSFQINVGMAKHVCINFFKKKFTLHSDVDAPKLLRSWKWTCQELPHQAHIVTPPPFAQQNQ